jgi:hypothetical protein
VDLFPSYEEALKFTAVYDFDVAQAALLEAAGRLADAAEVHITEGRYMSGILLFLKDTACEKSLLRAKECIVRELARRLCFGFNPITPRPGKELVEYLLLANRLLKSLSDTDHRNEVPLSMQCAFAPLTNRFLSS